MSPLLTKKERQRIGLRYVYVAGPLTPKGTYSKNPAIDYLYSVREMTQVAVRLVREGYAPFCPAVDFLYFMVGGREERIKEAEIKRYSIDWLEKCDCVVLCHGWQSSEGTKREIKRAEEMGLPVFKSLKEFLERDNG